MDGRAGRWGLVGLVLIVACPADPAASDAESSSTSTSTSTDGDTSSTSSTSSTTAVDEGSSSSSETTGGEGSDSGTTGEMPPEDPGCPECIVLVDRLESGRGIDVDATHVYFTDQSRGTVERIMKGGGDGAVLASDELAPYDVAVDADTVYWTNFADAGAVMRVAKAGGDAEVVDDTTSFPRAIDVDATHVYWSTFDVGSGALWRRANTLVDASEELATAFAGMADIVVGSTHVYVTAHVESLGGGTFIVEPPMGPPIGAVFAIPLTGDPDGTMTDTLASDVAEPWGIAHSGEGVFWATGDGENNNGPHSVYALELAAPPAALVASGQTAPWGVAADEVWIYWTDHSEVKAAPREGGEIVVLATLQNSARSIVVDDRAVYWITQDRVLQRPKP